MQGCAPASTCTSIHMLMYQRKAEKSLLSHCSLIVRVLFWKYLFSRKNTVSLLAKKLSSVILHSIFIASWFSFLVCFRFSFVLFFNVIHFSIALESLKMICFSLKYPPSLLLLKSPLLFWNQLLICILTVSLSLWWPSVAPIQE